MEENYISIRINLESREVEIKGNTEHIEKTYGSFLYECMEIIKNHPVKASDKPFPASAPESIKTSSQVEKEGLSSVPDSFGEYLSGFPKGLNNVDKLLLASNYLQSRSSQKSFTVSDASALLIEQGVKLSNAGAFNKANFETKKIFKLTGKEYRVSETGMDYIKSL